MAKTNEQILAYLTKLKQAADYDTITLTTQLTGSPTYDLTRVLGEAIIPLTHHIIVAQFCGSWLENFDSDLTAESMQWSMEEAIDDYDAGFDSHMTPLKLALTHEHHRFYMEFTTDFMRWLEK